RRIKEILERNPELKVVGFADNGRMAIEKANELKPDVITMDYEMPLLDGISAVRAIMAERPTPIMMFSSLSFEGARVTLDALDAGALDYLPKSFESMTGDPGESARILQERVIAIARRGRYLAKAQVAPPATAAAAVAVPVATARPALRSEPAAAPAMARKMLAPLETLGG